MVVCGVTPAKVVGLGSGQSLGGYPAKTGMCYPDICEEGFHGGEYENQICISGHALSSREEDEGNGLTQSQEDSQGQLLPPGFFAEGWTGMARIRDI